MEARTTLPLDIVLYIIDLVADGDCYEDIKSLQTLSQTCKSMVPLCRKHLFSSLRLDSEFSFERFSDLLSKNPEIACYVRDLNYGIYNPIGDHKLNILNILKERSSLQLIALSSEWLYWNDFPESTRSSLLSLIELPTVIHLYIYSIKGFPAIVLSGCSNLINLQLKDLEIASPEVNQVISRSKIPTPVSLYIGTETFGLAALLSSKSLHAGGPIVDISRLQKADFDVKSRDDIDQAYELIKVSSRLEHLNIDTCITDQPLQLAGLGASLAINAYRTLKLLEVGVTVVGDYYDPLCGLNRELRCIARNNVLEELVLEVVVNTDVPCRTNSEDWPTFDSVLTESGAFPVLRRVSVEFWWYTTNMLNHDLVESVKEDKFPRLVESKTVEFTLCAELHDGNR